MEYEESTRVTVISISVIIIVGIVGNLLNIYVFSHKSMRKNTTFRYLFYLSIIDLLVLLVATVDALFTFGFFIMIRAYSNFLCKTHTFMTYLLTQMSSNILMIVSIDRALIICNKKLYVSIKNFLKKQKFLKIDWYNSKRVGKLVLTVLILLGIFNSHYLIFMKLNEAESRNLVPSEKMKKAYRISENNSMYINSSYNYNNTNHKSPIENIQSKRDGLVCFPSSTSLYNHFLLEIWVWFDLVIYSIIPFTVMIICSIIIVLEIRSKSSSFITTSKNNKSACEKAKRRNKKMLIMLVVTNLYFIFCSLPLGADIIHYKFKAAEYEPHFLQSFFHILAYTNNSANIFFYILFSHKYRQILFSIFYRFKRTRTETI